jgi:hypothetical protein
MFNCEAHTFEARILHNIRPPTKIQELRMLNTDGFGLVVVDIQGKLARIVHNSDSVIRQTQKLIQCCQALAIPIVVLE